MKFEKNFKIVVNLFNGEVAWKCLWSPQGNTFDYCHHECDRNRCGVLYTLAVSATGVSSGNVIIEKCTQSKADPPRTEGLGKR